MAYKSADGYVHYMRYKYMMELLTKERTIRQLAHGMQLSRSIINGMINNLVKDHSVIIVRYVKTAKTQAAVYRLNEGY